MRNIASHPMCSVCLFLQTLDLVAAGGVPETFFTVWTNVFERGRLREGNRFSCTEGPAGSARPPFKWHEHSARECSRPLARREKCAACERLGAERAINYKTDDFAAVLLDLTDGRGVDVILDMVGAAYFSRNLDLLALEGRLLQIAVLHGAKAEINLVRLLRQRLTVTGSTLRARTVDEKGAIAKALERAVWPLLETGKIRPVIYETFPLTKAAEAHRLMESGSHIGKILLTV